MFFWISEKLPAVLKDIAVFKAGFHTEEELLLSGSELRTETEAQHAVLVTCQSLLIDQSAIPVVTLPEPTAGGFLPIVPHFTVDFHGIAIAQRMLVTNHRIQGIREQETGIQREFLVLCGCRKHGKRTTMIIKIFFI